MQIKNYHQFITEQALGSAMAIVFNLHCYLLLLLLTLSSTFFLHPHNLASANYSLIDQQCRQTDAPETCIGCIMSHPEAAEKADKPEDIAAILLTCLSDSAEILKSNFSMLASLVSKDDIFKSVCEICSKGYGEAETGLSWAADALKKSDYDEANHMLATALTSSEMISCSLNIESYKSEVPKILYLMRIYEELTGAAMSVIDRLPYGEKP